MTILDRAKSYLDTIPPAISGQDGHGQCFYAACRMVNGFALSEDDAFHLLKVHYNPRCVPEWSDRELIHKVEQAIKANHSGPRGHLVGEFMPMLSAEAKKRQVRRPKSVVEKMPPQMHAKARDEAAERFVDGFRCTDAELWEASPIRPSDDWTIDGKLLIGHLYQPDELVNVVHQHTESKDGKLCPIGKGMTKAASEWVSLLHIPFSESPAGYWIRMNPLDGNGIADVNVTAFRFTLLEFDDIPMDLQMALLAKLPLPIAAVITSGGRSIHAWIRVDADDVDDYRNTTTRILDMLKPLGVDHKNKNPSRLSRLPGVTRFYDKQKRRQELLYLNPTPSCQSIL